LAAVDVRAVRALQIGDDDAPVAEEQASMSFGNIALGQHEIVALHATDVDLVLVEDLATLGSALLTDDDREHASKGASLKRGRSSGSPTTEYTFSRADCQRGSSADRRLPSACGRIRLRLSSRDGRTRDHRGDL